MVVPVKYLGARCLQTMTYNNLMESNQFIEAKNNYLFIYLFNESWYLLVVGSEFWREKVKTHPLIYVSTA